MLFRAMGSRLALLFTFASLALHQQALAYEQDGEDWNYLVEFPDAASKWKDLPWRENSRALGTFWNLAKARKFNWKQALEGSEGGCGVVLYYEQMHIRHEQFNRTIYDGELARWMRPFAISPVCTDEARPQDQQGFPRREFKDKKTVQSVVFHNLRQNSNWDSYLVLK
jgi:hypothetical protein